jgi:hypothetical protein
MNSKYSYLLFFACFFVSLQSKAQKVISSIGETELKANLAFQPKDKNYLKFKLARHTPVVVPNSDSTKFMMIGFDRDSQYAFLLNQDLQVEKSFVNEVQEENPKEKKNSKDKKKDVSAEDNADIVRKFMKTYTEPLGNFSRGNKAVVIYTNSNKTEFGTLMVDFDSNKFVSTIFPIKLETERFVEGFMYKGNFCLMTAGKKLDYMRFHIIEDYNKVQKYKEIQYGNHFQNLREFVFKSQNWSKVSQAVVIDYQTYNELGTTQKPAKIYLTSNEVLLTIEDMKLTNILFLDIENEKMTVKSYPRTEVTDSNWDTRKSNSFLYYNYLVQASCTYDRLALDFVDIRTSEKIKSYMVEKKDSISFKNTSIFQDKSGAMSFGLASGGLGGSFSVPYNNSRILKKTSQLLNKITGATLAIAINPDKDGNIKMTLGSYLERQQGGGGGMMMVGGAGVGAAPMFIPTPMMGGYNAGKYIKSAYFESSFSLPNFEHNKERKILQTDNVLDRIRAYEEKMEESNTLTLKYIFRRYNEFIYCYYNSSGGKYYFVPFPIVN